jgi:hypothetical protein
MNITPAKPEISIDEISIVLVGDFNPKIFHPMWFLQEGLIRETEAMEANIEISHRDVCIFSLEWITIQVLRERFTATIKADAFKKHIGDLVLNVFSKLSHTPVHQFGMNTSLRLRFKSSDDWHAFGHYLLPKSPWDNVMDKPGLRSCQVQGIRAEDKRPGLVITFVDPDLSTNTDVVIKVNDHFDVPTSGNDNKSTPLNSKWVIEILREDFESSIERATTHTNKLIENFLLVKVVDAGVGK